MKIEIRNKVNVPDDNKNITFRRISKKKQIDDILYLDLCPKLDHQNGIFSVQIDKDTIEHIRQNQQLLLFEIINQFAVRVFRLHQNISPSSLVLPARILNLEYRCPPLTNTLTFNGRVKKQRNSYFVELMGKTSQNQNVISGIVQVALTGEESNER